MTDQFSQLSVDLSSDRRRGHADSTLHPVEWAAGIHPITSVASSGIGGHCYALHCYIGSGEEALLRENAILEG
jgi:hypothetical protein